MEYKNPFFAESILSHYVELPYTSYITNNFVNKYHIDRREKEMSSKYANAQSGNGMTFGGTKIKTSVLLLVFSITYTASWFSFQFKVFGHQFFIVLAALLLALFLALWMVNRPEHSSFLGPSSASLFGIVLGGTFQFLAPGFGESLLYAIGIPICVLITMMFVLTESMLSEKHKLKTLVIGSLFSTSLLYFYVILMEYVFRIPMHFPLALDSAFILILAICLVGAVYCFRSDLEVLDLSITYGAPGYIEWYYAFSIFATTVWFYVAGFMFLIQMMLDDD